MAFMKRFKIELWSVGFALSVLALFAERAPSQESCDPSALSATQVLAESALYLDGAAREARYDGTSHRWQVTDGRDVAWLDGATGELVEIELSPRG